MQIDVGIVFGLIAAAGASYRAYKGYQGHLKKKNYEEWDWKKFLISVLPVTVVAFVAGATYQPLPGLMSSEAVTLGLMFFLGGAGLPSLQSKLTKS